MANLFIGLGGTGLKTVAKLKEEFENYKSFKKGDKKYAHEFIFFDTDAKDRKDYPLIQDSEFIDMGNIVPDDIFKRLKSEPQDPKSIRINSWFDKANITNTDKPLKAGAKGIRMLARICLEQKLSEFKDCFDKKTKALKANNGFDKDKQVDGKQFKIYVISGSCGGSGSSILIDILYFIQMYFAENSWANGNPDVTLVLLGPSQFIKPLEDSDNRKGSYTHNAYAFFQELNAVFKDNLSTESDAPAYFHKASVIPFTGKRDKSKFVPFTSFLFIDNTSNDCELDSTYVYEFISQLIFDLEISRSDDDGGNIDGAINSCLTNDLSAFNSKNDAYIKAIVAPGKLSLLKTDDLLKEYFQGRMYFEVLQYGILGVNDFEFNDKEKETLIAEFESKILKTQLTKLEKNIEVNFELIKSDFETKKTSIDKIEFAKNVLNRFKSNSKSSNLNLEKVFSEFDLLIDNIKDLIYEYCSDITFSNNVHYSYKYFYALDRNYYEKIKEQNFNTIEELCNNKNFNSKEISNLIVNFKALAKSYFYNILCKKLSDDGILDKCKTQLDYILNFINNKNYFKKDWDNLLLKKICDLKKNSSIAFLPSLNEIINDKGAWKQDNDFEILYYKVFPRNKNNKPINILDNDNPTLVSLNKIKLEVFKIINSNNPNQKNLKDIIKPENIDVKSQDVILEQFIESLDFHIKKIVDENQMIIDECNESIIDRFEKKTLRPEKERIIKIFSDYTTVQFPYLPTIPTTTYTAIVGPFTGDELPVSLQGNNNDIMNHQIIKNNYYKDKIIKIVMKTNLSLKDYSEFDEYEKYFKNNIKSQSGKLIKQPFIHKDFIGKDFSGDVWKFFQENNDIASDTAQDLIKNVGIDNLFKYGLLYLNAVLEVLKTTKDFKEDLKNIISYAKPNISINDTIYNKVTKKYTSKKSSIIDLNISYDKNQINNFSDTIRTIISHIESPIESIKDKYAIHKQAYIYFIEISDEKHGDKIIESFADISSEKEIKEFLPVLKKLFE